ncbi:MAG: hypothetical protein BGP24_07655 [Lysobacterales bacterium 69-70]|nr:hypothetical protein [Xanthomonadaceae bacterium]OJY93642.1 MAG: hypothetical protein BGP24_07655 [Xanthomonadales bacterium 69-70]
MIDPQPPIACSLDAGDFRDRLAWIAAVNRDHLVSERRDGQRLVLTYRPDALQSVRDLVAKESACCAFLAFDLTERADVVRLTVSVPDEVLDHADELLAPFRSGAVHPGSDDAPLKYCGACP